MDADVNLRDIEGEPHRGDVVVVTGASAGVGRATARAFARRGARLGLLARGREGLEATKREVEELGGQALAIPTDVADPAAVDAAAEAVEEAFGPIDVWVNNAMTTVFAPFEKITPEEFRRVTEVTYLGHVYGTLAALKRMKPRDCGSIVQVGSALAYRGIPLQSAYCGAKHGIKGFTESLLAELGHDGSAVRMSMVHLPAMNTPQFRWCLSRMPRKAQPVPPIFQPEVAADAIVWAAYHDRRELLVGFPTVKVVWGNKLFPLLGDLYLAKTGVDSQMHDGPEDPERPYNLWQPVEGDRGAHGAFDERAQDESLQLVMTTHRAGSALLGALAVGAIGLALGALLRRV